MRKLYIALILSVFSNVFFVTAQNANWSAVSPALFPTNASGQIHGISRVSQMKFHPTNSNKMYAVSARGGLFISVNGGTNWTVAPGCDFMPFSTFASVCIDFTDDQIIYLGAGDHDYYYSWGGVTGVWKSTNGGQTFIQTTLNNRLIIDMVMDPNDHNIVVAVTDGGIYKTLNGGSSWSLKTSSRSFDDLKQKTPTSRVLYAATTDTAFFRSTDFGDTWSQINSGIVLPSGVTNGNGCRLAVTPADTNIVYLGMVANSGIIYKSTNGGTSFTGIKTTVPPYLTYYDNLSTSSGQGDYNFGIGADRVNANILYLVAHNVWKSTDGGSSWTQLTNWWAEVHTDMHQINTSPYNNGQLWNMNDGGVWLSTDGGDTWAPKSDGIYGYEIYHGSCSPTRRDMHSIGTQDNGELYASSSGWFTNRGGDWQSHCVFDYRANSSMAYYFDPDWGTVQLPQRRLVTGSPATYGLPSNVTDFTDISFHRSNPNLAFVADTMIFRTTNLSVTTPSWTQIVDLNKKIMTLHCSHADANRLYAITSDGVIYVSTDALSGSPTFTSNVLPNSTNNAASITSIKTSPNTIYVTCNTKVYRSTDNGVNWTNITYNLPSVNHVRVMADEYSPSNELVFIASNGVVYYKTASATSWTIYNTNLPSRTTIVDMSVFNDSTPNTLLRVATYGRGMWETPITNLHVVTANFTADNTTPCLGGTVQFSDLSTGNVTSRSWSFPGGTPSTSSAINPSVVYSSSGSYNVSLTVSDGITNNSITKTNYIKTTGGNLPLAEGFEGASDPPDGWKNIDNGTQNYRWVKTSAAGGFGASSNSMFYDNYNWNIQGERDELQVKRLDFSGYNSVTLTFDVAYQVYTGYSDSLAVLVSTDCGSNFTRIFVKGGSTLSTAGSATANFVPTAAQWRTESVALNSYAGLAGVIVEFQNINGYGNNLYIDNININATVAASAGNDASICSGGSVGIGMNPVSGVNYSWSPVTGLSSPSISNPIASPVVTTSYVFTATQATSGILNRDTILVNVTPSVVASVSIAASPTGAICSGTSVTFTATPANGGTTPAYQWKKNSVNVGTGSTYVSASLVNNDTVKCVMTSNAVCVTGSPATSNSIIMVVNAIAGVSISANTGNTICAGTNVIFTATPVNGGTTPSYQWKKNSVNVGTGNSYATSSLANNDTLVCVMISNAPCVTGNPATSNSIIMTVNPVSTAAVSISANPGNIICSGTSVTFTAAPVNGGTTPSYIWKKNSVNVGSGNTYTTSSLANNDTVICVMTSNALCVSGSPATSNIIIMMVNPNVTAGVIISANPGNTVCMGTGVTFTASPTNGGTVPAYQWIKNGVNVGTDSTYTTSSLANNDTVKCVMTSNVACVAGNPVTSNSIIMTVNPTVTATVSIAANQGNSICAGTSVTFTATPANGGSVPSYLWKKNGVNVRLGPPTYITISLANNDTIICIMTSNASCVIGSPATSNSIIMTVNPNITASVSIAANPGSTICSGTSVTFTAFPVNGGASPAYQWKKNNVNTGTGNSYTTSSISNQDTVKCVMTSNAPCMSGSPATSNSLIMTVTPNVTASVSIEANPAGAICPGTNVTFTPTPVEGGVTPAYQWQTNGVNVATGSLYSTTALTDLDTVKCVMTSSAVCAVPSGGSTSNSIVMTVNVCSVTLNIKVFLEGFYYDHGLMQAVADPANYPTLCDTLIAELHDAVTPYDLAYSVTSTIDIYGNGTFIFPGLITGNSYYIVIRHRNLLETWSKDAVFFNSSTVNFDFTKP